LVCGDDGQCYRGWPDDGRSKVVLRVVDETGLLAVHAMAIGAGLPAVLIRDRGLTELEPGAATCLASDRRQANASTR
jgi:peptidyl-tRNA hydrolase